MQKSCNRQQSSINRFSFLNAHPLSDIIEEIHDHSLTVNKGTHVTVSENFKEENFNSKIQSNGSKRNSTFERSFSYDTSHSSSHRGRDDVKNQNQNNHHRKSSINKATADSVFKKLTKIDSMNESQDSCNDIDNNVSSNMIK